MRILYFQSSFCATNVSELEGAYRYARDQNITLQTVQYDQAKRDRRLSCVSCGADVKKLLSFWKPDGCIVECGGKASCFRPVDFGKIPIVFLDGDPDVFGDNVVCIYSDADDIAACAARELLSLGFADYAYLPYPDDPHWSRSRGAAFAAYVAENGKNLHLLEHDGEKLDTKKLHLGLAAWVRCLPRPCGIFAANDTLSSAFVRVAFDGGFRIPQDFAVVGVDDDTQLCENAAVSLTSIATDNYRAGYLAAEILVQRIRSRQSRARATFGVVKLHRRASTRLFRNADARVLKAIEFIRRHATEGIAPTHVVAEMGCSRRLADLRFREVIGHSILDEIHSVRLAKVKELLKRPKVDMAVLPDFCGYGSIADLRRVFKQRVGMTMGAFVKS